MSLGKIKILHIINSLDHGGAEEMLCRLLVNTDQDRFEPRVVSLIDSLKAAEPLRRANVPIETMGVRPGVPDPRGFWRLVRYLRRSQPDIVQTWMDHSNLIGGVACFLAGRASVVWGVHHSDHVVGLTKRTTLWTVSACARLSRRLPSLIISVSEKSRDLYLRQGFAADKIVVIPNGFDLDAYHPDPNARQSLRRELGVGPETPLIGLVARYHILKDHPNFFHAAAILGQARPDVHFVLCGRDVVSENPVIADLVSASGMADRIHLLGHRSDVAKLQAALDIATSSSVSEAFPLSVGEAMACGVPCVVTDVGDSARIVGDAGYVVPPRNSPALAQAWGEILAMDPEPRTRLGIAARERIVALYDLRSVSRRYEQIYLDLATRRGDNAKPLTIATRHAEHDSHINPLSSNEKMLTAEV